MSATSCGDTEAAMNCLEVSYSTAPAVLRLCCFRFTTDLIATQVAEFQVLATAARVVQGESR